tara:strand:+ start:236 stop:439 length:204 start_codon:yes stop_codon:yes gene_type:complete
MTIKNITENVTNIKENYQNGNITGDELCELLDDLVCEIEESNGAFSVESDDDYYQTFEETDFTKLEI